MLSINTNLSSMIAQKSMKQSTNILNQAIERMTTGAKINHASDNAANYSISSNMSTQLNSYGVAQDNVAMGLDMVNVSSDNLELINNKLTRLRDLQEQAMNGTYGEESLKAINKECNALVDEIVRVYNSTEYNGIKLFNTDTPVITLTTDERGFLNSFEIISPDVIVSDPTQLADAITNNTVIGISNAETFAKLAELVNSGTSCENKTIMLTDDIDLSAYKTGTGWTPIGTSTNKFKGTFDGQGHIITNLYINRVGTGTNFMGVFGDARVATIKNTGVKDGTIITDNNVVSLLAATAGSVINSWTSGSIDGSGISTGGIVGQLGDANLESIVDTSYSKINVNSTEQTGGLIGAVAMSSIVKMTNCFADSNIIATGNSTGGMIGTCLNSSQVEISNSYANTIISSNGSFSGGLIGSNGTSAQTSVTNCYTQGNVSSNTTTRDDGLGGLIGSNYGNMNIEHSYSLANVRTNAASSNTGGFLGAIGQDAITKINDSYSTGNVEVIDSVSGASFVGYIMANGSLELTNCKALSRINQADSNIFVSDNQNTASIKIDNCQYASYLQGRNYTKSGGTITINNVTEYNKNNAPFSLEDIINKLSLQVGINGNSNSQISFDAGFSIGRLDTYRNIGLSNTNCLKQIDNLLLKISEKQTHFGAVQNRLDSALEEIGTHIENLASSRSTLRDADIAKESSEYIRGQILQQASATLLSTANQSPTIALSLLTGIRQ